jgi:hypothetical protein
VRALVSQHRGVTAILGAILATLLMLSLASSAKAFEEHQFCTGKSLGPNETCSSGYWHMNAAYATSPHGPICLSIFDYLSCMKKPNEGVFLGSGDQYGYYTQAKILHLNPPGTFKVYGTFWTAEPAPYNPPKETPPAPPATYRYMLGTSTGSGVSSWSSILAGMSRAERMTLGDISGDGKADIVTVEDEGNGKFRYMLGTGEGSGVSSWKVILPGMSAAVSLELGDVTGDGKEDVVTVENEGSGKVRYMLGTSSGSGISSWKSILSSMSPADDMAVGDMGDDGNADILTAEAEGNGKFRYMLGTGSESGISSWKQIMSGMSNPSDMELGDVTGDGKADIVTEESEGNGQCRYMLGTGTGSGVSSWKQALSGMTCGQFDVDDFTGDGKADIVAFESAGAGKYRYALGASYGSGFTWSQLLSGLDPSPVRSLGDISGDGEADIVGVEEE